jgi:hypothetical protein
VLAFGLFFFLPTFLIAFSALIFVMIAEVATYLIMRHQKVGLQDLKEQFHEWRTRGKKEKGLTEVAGQVTIVGKGNAPVPPPTAEDPIRPAYDAVQAASPSRCARAPS